jgi:predicted PurR-regulated permease PerM
VLAVTTGQALDVVLAVFLVIVGLAIAYALWKLGVLLAQLRRTVRNTEREVLPVISKTGGTIDRVNSELDKLDTITDSAVEAVGAIDRAVRAVSSLVTAPVQALAGAATAIRYGVSSFLAHRDMDEAVRAAKDAAARRMADLAEELDQTSQRPSQR